MIFRTTTKNMLVCINDVQKKIIQPATCQGYQKGTCRGPRYPKVTQKVSNAPRYPKGT